MVPKMPMNRRRSHRIVDLDLVKEYYREYHDVPAMAPISRELSTLTYAQPPVIPTSPARHPVDGHAQIRFSQTDPGCDRGSQHRGNGGCICGDKNIYDVRDGF